MDTGTVKIKVLEQEDVEQIQKREQVRKNKDDMTAARRVYKQVF